MPVVYEDNRFAGYGAEICRDRRRGGVRLPRRPGDAHRRPGRARACRTTTCSRTGSWSTRRRSRTASASSPRTDGARPSRGSSTRSRSACAALLARTRTASSRRDLRHPDAAQARREGARLVRVREARDEVRLVLPAAGPRARRRCASSLSPALAKSSTGRSTFNFAAVDEALFAELEGVIARAFDLYMGEGQAAAERRLSSGR